jgi:transcriptional regulator with XRE-family HTH domain
MAEEPKEPGLLAQRLQHLYDTPRPGGRKYSDREVAEAVNAIAGEHVTGRTYVYQLRKGTSDNPTYKLLIALAKFFGVSPTYFFDEQPAGLPPEAVALLRDDEARDIGLAAAGLSGRSRQAIRQMIDSAREIEGR